MTIYGFMIVNGAAYAHSHIYIVRHTWREDVWQMFSNKCMELITNDDIVITQRKQCKHLKYICLHIPLSANVHLQIHDCTSLDLKNMAVHIFIPNPNVYNTLTESTDHY